MAAKNFYDAVLVGLDLPTLLAGALLAKRGFRVLLIGQGQCWPSYTLSSVRLPRAPFLLDAPDSPALGRVFSELALRPLIQRRTRRLAPAFQAVMPRHRIDLQRDGEALMRELARELPTACRDAEALLRRAEEHGQRLDPLLARDLMWPPMRFLERRAFARATANDPLADEALSREGALDGGAMGRILAACLRFVDGSGQTERRKQTFVQTPRTLRLLRGRLGAAELCEGGLDGLYELLLESIRTHSGSMRLSDRVDAITLKRGAVERLHIMPSDEEIGCHFLLWGLPAARLAGVLDDRSGLDALFAEEGEPQPHALRFTLNLLLRAEALPEGMARDVLLLGEEPLWVESQRLFGGDRALVCVQALIDADTLAQRPQLLSTQRERMRAGLVQLSPFFDQHLELVDSPHDGRPPESALGEGTVALDPLLRRGPDTMEVVYAYPRTRVHDTAALPVRTPIKRLLLCNGQVVPGLGLEGTFLTAWSSARAVTRSLARDWMNRGRWTKVEL